MILDFFSFFLDFRNVLVWIYNRAQFDLEFNIVLPNMLMDHSMGMWRCHDLDPRVRGVT